MEFTLEDSWTLLLKIQNFMISTGMELTKSFFILTIPSYESHYESHGAIKKMLIMKL